MGLLDTLSSLAGITGREGIPEGMSAGLPGAGTEGLTTLLNSSAMGEIARKLLGGGEGDLGGLKNAILSDTDAALWKSLVKRVAEDNPKYGTAAGNESQHAARVIRALVFAAKSDGHINDKEEDRLSAEIQSMEIGREGEALVQTALVEPVDTVLIASGVGNAHEALELYTITAAIINPDNAMQKKYLETLGTALTIPQDVRDEVEHQLRTRV